MIELLLPYLEEVAAVSATHKLAESLKRVGGLALATAGLCHAMNCLHRVSGSRLPKGVSGTYGDVGEFWSLGVDGHAAGDEARVKVTGLLLPYGPFIPAHPLDRPGASMDGWDFVGDLSVDDTEEYDAVDAAIYGDRVLRICEPDLTPDKCYFGGLYGHFYGRSDVALPLLLPTQVLEKNSIDPASVWRQLCFRGWLVRLDGVLKQIPSFYEAYYEAAANNKERKVPPDLLRKGRYPNFALEVRKIDFRQPGAGVTHIAASVAWKGRSGKERAQTAYFNAQEASEWQKCERSLDARRGSITRLWLDYDDVNYMTPRARERLPQYNALLRRWFRRDDGP